LQPVLVDTTLYPWIPDRWITRICQTLNEYNIKIYHDAWVFCPLRCNDVFLMEAIQELGLNNSQLKQINACRMYLKVTTLAEIVDHMGMMLLPQILCRSQAQSPQGLDDISSSNLNWPCIHLPTQASWCLWTMTICTLFAGHPNGQKIHHKLGEWMAYYQEAHKWQWKLSSQGSLLHQATLTSTIKAAICMQTHHTALKFSLTVPMNQ